MTDEEKTELLQMQAILYSTEVGHIFISRASCSLLTSSFPLHRMGSKCPKKDSKGKGKKVPLTKRTKKPSERESVGSFFAFPSNYTSSFVSAASFSLSSTSGFIFAVPQIPLPSSPHATLFVTTYHLSSSFPPDPSLAFVLFFGWGATEIKHSLFYTDLNSKAESGRSCGFNWKRGSRRI